METRLANFDKVFFFIELLRFIVRFNAKRLLGNELLC